MYSRHCTGCYHLTCSLFIARDSNPFVSPSSRNLLSFSSRRDCAHAQRFSTISEQQKEAGQEDKTKVPPAPFTSHCPATLLSWYFLHCTMKCHRCRCLCSLYTWQSSRLPLKLYSFHSIVGFYRELHTQPLFPALERGHCDSSSGLNEILFHFL